MGKLDAIAASGPEGDVLEWGAVDWRQAEDDVPVVGAHGPAGGP